MCDFLNPMQEKQSHSSQGQQENRGGPALAQKVPLSPFYPSFLPDLQVWGVPALALLTLLSLNGTQQSLKEDYLSLVPLGGVLEGVRLYLTLIVAKISLNTDHVVRYFNHVTARVKTTSLYARYSSPLHKRK